MHADSSHRGRSSWFAATVALLSWASLWSATPNAAPAAALSIRVDDPWIRWLPAGVPAAGYFTLINPGDESVALIAAASADFRDVSIHRSVERGGVMQMEEVGEIIVDPHSRLDLAAKGYHLMLMNPVRPIELEKRIPITLRFRDGTSLTVPFDVRKPGAGS
jgi:copper(I)-binding protein